MVGTRSRQTKPAQELGERLRQERKRKHLTLMQAMETLNIPLYQLKALEEGDFSVFGAEIYARGACLKYVTYLGVESEEAERAVWRALSAGRHRVPLKIHTAFSFFERLWSARSVLWAGIGLVALMIGGYIAWQVQSFWQLPQLYLAAEIASVTNEQQIVVKGVAQSEVKVAVNDEPIVLYGDASFETTVRLHPGINVLRIEAENAAGRKAVIEKHVLLARK